MSPTLRQVLSSAFVVSFFVMGCGDSKTPPPAQGNAPVPAGGISVANPNDPEAKKIMDQKMSEMKTGKK